MVLNQAPRELHAGRGMRTVLAVSDDVSPAVERAVHDYTRRFGIAARRTEDRPVQSAWNSDRNSGSATNRQAWRKIACIVPASSARCRGIVKTCTVPSFVRRCSFT